MTEFRSFAYRHDCPEGRLFTNRAEYDAALAEGWCDRPLPAPAALGAAGDTMGGAAVVPHTVVVRRLSPADVAQVAHEINRAYCAALGDASQPAWFEAPGWQQRSAINGVLFHLRNPDAGPEASHTNWLQEKAAEGWTYGESKDPEAKTHPCIVPFDELPVEQQAKDYLFRAVVHSLVGLDLVDGALGDDLKAAAAGAQGEASGESRKGTRGRKRK